MKNGGIQDLTPGHPAAQSDEGPYAECARERATQYEMAIPTPRAGRGAKQDPQITAGRHDQPR